MLSDNNCVIVGSLKSLPLVLAVIGSVGIAVFNSFELFITIFLTFRRRTGIYFYSMIGSTGGVFIYSIFVLLLVLESINNYISVGLINLAWYFMVTGQALVLYSRLHLILCNARMLKWILVMIIINGVVCHPIETGLSMKVGFFASPTSETYMLTIFFIHREFPMGYKMKRTCHG
jgi:hypothetical protein